MGKGRDNICPSEGNRIEWAALVNSLCAGGSLGQPRPLSPWEQDPKAITVFPARRSSLALLQIKGQLEHSFGFSAPWPCRNIAILHVIQATASSAAQAASGSVAFCELRCNPHLQKEEGSRERNFGVSSPAFIGWNP